MDELTFRRIASTAVKDQKMVRISYEDHRGVVTDRRCEPYEIKPERSGLTFYGYSIDPGSQGIPGIRKFKIFQIIKAEVIDEIFVPRWPIQIMPIEPDVIDIDANGQQVTQQAVTEPQPDKLVEGGNIASLKQDLSKG